MKDSILSVIAREHALDVLKILLKEKEKGLRHKQLRISILALGGTIDPLLEPLRKKKLIDHNEENGNYYISVLGEKILSHALTILKLEKEIGDE